jgi:iron complex outermembrane receptor protein
MENSMNRFQFAKAAMLPALISGVISAEKCLADAVYDQEGLNEVVVTAQKRQQPLQDTPIAISVIESEQLDILGISDFAGMTDGIIPSLHVVPFGSTPSNVVLSIRGNAARDPGEISREGSVAVYLDGVYIGRSHGLGLQLPDLERIEVLRGPQGTLFGRNAIGGAVSIVSKKPTGEFGLKQSIGMGRFDELRSVTRINFDEVAGVRAKLDYLHSERDGWVDNTAPGEVDYNQYEKDGGRLSLLWDVSESVSVGYSYDKSKVSTAQNYYQFYKDYGKKFAEERYRLSQTRLPVTSLDPTIVETSGHSLIVNWEVSEKMSVKSISAHRKLNEDANNNYAGILYYNGLNDASVMDQEQLTQEFQFIGTHERLNWVAGIYYFKEDAHKNLQDKFTLDINGNSGRGLLSAISPPTTYDYLSKKIVPAKIVDADARSWAAYGQFTWNPEILSDRLFITLGGRHTDDKKAATRQEVTFHEFDQKSDNFDTTAGVDLHINDDLSTYLKWTTAYKAGGVNSRSTSFSRFEEEVVKTLELGLKSEFWQRRGRFNLAMFNTNYEDMQLDFIDPEKITHLETINAQKIVKVNGAEIDVSLIPIAAVQIGFSYSYLDTDMPLQPNPLAGGALKEFFIPLAPKNAGAMTIDYQFSPLQFGQLSAHLDMTSIDKYSYAPFGEQRFDSYTILNARITLAGIKMGGELSTLRASIWAKNLADEEYIINAFAVGEGDGKASIGQTFGDPRTFGLDITLDL